MARRFEMAIKRIEDEKLRIIGKVSVAQVEAGRNPMYAHHVRRVKNLNEAIEILKNHPRNVNV